MLVYLYKGVVYIYINRIIKINNYKYKCFFEDDELILYSDVIINNNLLTKKYISDNLFKKISNENVYYDAYYKAINYISIKMRYRKEIYLYLNMKGFNDKIIFDVIDRLYKYNYLNDEKYVVSFINDKINFSNYGPYKIYNNLIHYEFDSNLVASNLKLIDDSVWINKVNNLIDKRLNYYKGSRMHFISKTKNYLNNLGFSDIYLNYLYSNLEVNSNIDVDYNKYLNKYKEKYSNEDFILKLANYLESKGYTYEEIDNYINKKLNE